jgi:hypothetical protein
VTLEDSEAFLSLTMTYDRAVKQDAKVWMQVTEFDGFVPKKDRFSMKIQIFLQYFDERTMVPDGTYDWGTAQTFVDDELVWIPKLRANRCEGSGFDGQLS